MPRSPRRYPTTVAAALCVAMVFGCATPKERSQTNNRVPNEVLVLRYFSVWANGGDPRAADALMSQDVVLRHPHTTLQGLSAYKASMAAFRKSFPDLKFTVEDIAAHGEKVLARWTMEGTQKAEFMGKAAAGSRISVGGMSLFRVEAGRIREIWVSSDRLGMMQQLGLVPDTLGAPKPPGS